ncbi:hypothetical protein [Ruegeria lacuscaerulensis]|uniref:hypothetical protein n=1 Tax=Ruegeria lacuscaerulensis TaxID=55218 RepID=UPI001F232D02|nr:hypothetical protein [Ruegeria lacuscaerulensis]
MDQLDADATEPSGSVVLFFLCLAVIFIVTMFWIAVSWHRFILLEEYPRGLFPTFRFDRILAYLGRVLLIGLVMTLAFVPVSLVAATVGASVLSLVLVAVFSVFLFICFYRLSIILPAAAIGQPLTLGEAWAKTVGSSGAIVVIVIAAAVFQFLIQLVISALAIVPVLGAFLALFFGALVLPMINVSILTTLFGVFAEGRELR